MGLLFSVFYLCFGHAYCRSISIFVCQSVLNGPPYLFHKGGIKEKPLVLHSKVKSSGYTSSPRQDHRVSFCLIENQIIITVNSNERENVITFFIFLGFLYFHTTVGRASPRTAYIKMYHTCYKTYLQNSRYHNARFTEHLTLSQVSRREERQPSGDFVAPQDRASRSTSCNLFLVYCRIHSSQLFIVNATSRSTWKHHLLVP